jgi:hypothetical protein
VTIELVQTDAAGDLGSTIRALCEFEGGPGRALVPAAVLSLFGKDPSLSNTISFAGNSKVDTTLGGYWIHASLLNSQSASFTLM